jgi:hypothetical protein
LWWDKVALGRFSPSTSVSPPIVVRSTNYSTITLIYHPGKMHNRPMCGRSAGTYTDLGDLQRDLRGLSPTPPNKKNTIFSRLLMLTLIFLGIVINLLPLYALIFCILFLYLFLCISIYSC